MVEGIKINRGYILLIIALSFAIILGNNGILSLWDQDESAYAGFALNMIETGNWLIPNFDWSGIHRKPPLHFWSIALSYKVFGYTEFAVRFPAFVGLALSTAVMFYLGRPLIGRNESLLASAMVASSPLLLSLCKISVTDSTLFLFELTAALSIFNYLRSFHWSYLLILWVSIAGGTLTKGPPILILSLGILGVLFLVKRFRWKVLVPVIVVILGILPLFLWGRLAWINGGKDFIQWMVDWYIFKRDEGVLGQTGPPGYFLLIFILITSPFIGWLIPGINAFFTELKTKNSSNIWWFLLAWMSAGWWIYEFIPSKLPAYANGGLPALFILISIQIIRRSNYLRKAGFVSYLVFSSLFSLALMITGGKLFTTDSTLSMIVITSGVLFGVFAYLHIKKSQLTLIPFFQVLLISCSAWYGIIPAVEDDRSVSKRTANHVINASNGNPVIFTKHFSQPSLAFYVAREMPNYTTKEDVKQLAPGKTYIFDQENLPRRVVDQPEKFNRSDFSGIISDRVKDVTYSVVTVK